MLIVTELIVTMLTIIFMQRKLLTVRCKWKSFRCKWGQFVSILLFSYCVLFYGPKLCQKLYCTLSISSTLGPAYNNTWYKRNVSIHVNGMNLLARKIFCNSRMLVASGTQCNDVFTLSRTGPRQEQEPGPKQLGGNRTRPMSLFMCNVNASTQFHTTHSFPAPVAVSVYHVEKPATAISFHGHASHNFTRFHGKCMGFCPNPVNFP